MTTRLFVLFFMIISASFRIYAQEIYTPEVGECVRPRMKTLAKEQRDGYECRYIEFSTEQEERIKAYLLPYLQWIVLKRAYLKDTMIYGNSLNPCSGHSGMCLACRGNRCSR